MVEIGDENGELDLLDKFDDLLFCVVNAARFNAPQSRAESLEKNRDSIDLLRTALKKLKKAQAINPELDISGTFIKLEKNLEMAEQRLPEQKAGRPVDFRTTHALVQLYFHTNQILGKPSYQLIHYFMKAAFPEKEWLPDYLTKRIAVLKKRFPKDDAYQYYLNPPKNLT